MQSFNLIEMWHSMAPLAKAVNVLLAICSVYSLWVIVDRSLALRTVKKKSAEFVEGLREQLKSKSLDGALQLATRKGDSPVGRLVHDALTEYREGGVLPIAGEYDPIEAVERVIERVKEREVADLKRGLGGLASISSAAPFIGLFGTVVGIINAFRSMAATGQGGLGAVSAGISEALFTTAVGLLVAIPAVMTFNYFSTVIERFVVDMNGVGSELVSFVLREVAVTPQHHVQHAPQHQQHHHPASHPPPQHYGSHPPPPQRPASVHPSHPPQGGHRPPSGYPQQPQHPSQPPASGYPPHYYRNR